jgi:cytochrome P450
VTVRLTRFEDVRDAFRQRDLRQAIYDESGVLLDGTVLKLHGEPHRRRRLLEGRLFRVETLRGYERDVILPAIEATVRPFPRDGRLDLVPMAQRVTLVLAALIAGVDRPLGTPEELERLLELGRWFGRGTILMYAPAGNREQVREGVRRALDAFEREFLAPSRARRLALLERFGRGEVPEAELPRDVLTVLLRNQDRLDLPADVVRREVAAYLMAGSHSTVMAFTKAMHDVFGWLERHPGDRDQLAGDLPFVQRCVHESLRLNPASPVGRRIAVAEVRLRGGTLVREGDLVELDMMAANRDQAVFGSDAGRFSPWRTLPEDVPPWGVTFGTGAHACIGLVLAGGLDPAHQRDDPEERNYGSVALLARAMFRRGARVDPERPPVRDPRSTRPQWSSYPVLLANVEDGGAASPSPSAGEGRGGGEASPGEHRAGGASTFGPPTPGSPEARRAMGVGLPREGGGGEGGGS